MHAMYIYILQWITRQHYSENLLFFISDTYFVLDTLEEGFNPFPHIDAFWRLSSRRLFENIVTKEEIAQNVQFLLLPQCFPI